MRKWLAVLIDAYNHFQESDGWAIASHIALSALTSLFPFLIFATALGGFFGSKELADQAASVLLESWPQAVAQPLVGEIHKVLTSSGGEALRIGLNRAYGEAETRPWYLLRLESVGFVFIGAIALLALALLVVLAPLVLAALDQWAPTLGPLWKSLAPVRLGLVTLAVLAALVMVHKWLPVCHLPLRNIWPGIVFTLVLSSAFAFAFGFYLERFPSNYSATYAGLASVMIALLFLSTLASIFVYGGELNAAIRRAQRPKAD